MVDFTQLSEKFPSLELERNFSFARHATIGCGGSAAVCAYPGSGGEAAELLCYLLREGIPYCILGAGANVLPGSGFFEGVVVRLTKLNTLTADGTFLHIGAGVTGGALCRFARQQRLTGFEAFTGIPMTLGGGVTMNAGVQGRHFSDVVERVTAVEKGKIKIFSQKDCDFSEKSSVFQSGIVITELILRGEPAPQTAIEERTAFFRARRVHLPKGRSMGCTFVNPEGLSAGKLIEDCGLKGCKRGGAKISETHANFIINEGGTADDVAQLIEFAQKTVERRTGIRLREEIRRIAWTT